MTVRNIRAYQSRGVLDPPVLERRTGYYDSRHVERLETVRDLLASGLTLNAVHALLLGLSDLASDMTRLLTPGEPEPVRTARRRPVEAFVPTARPVPELEETSSPDAISRVAGISAMRQDLFADDLPADAVFRLVRRLDALTDAALDEWVAALEPYWESATPRDSADPEADTRRLTEQLNPAAVDFAVALFDLTLRRRTAEHVAARAKVAAETR